MDGSGAAPAGPKVDYSALMMKAPNTTYMMSDEDVVARLPGSDRIINTLASHVPPLCRAWVLLSCPHQGTACSKRHYFVDDGERRKNSEARQSKEHALDMDCLLSISTREALLESIATEAAASMSTYLRDEDATEVGESGCLLFLRAKPPCAHRKLG